MKKSTSNELSVGTDAILSFGDKSILFETVASSVSKVFSDPQGLTTGPVPGQPNKLYVKWGADDQMPYNLIENIESDEILSENKAFNVKACFGAQGIRFYDKESGSSTKNEDVNDFYDSNAYMELFTSQIYDMIYFCWSLDVIILNADCSRIVSIIHKPAENVRFMKADEQGIIHEAYYANWRLDAAPVSEVETIQLLDWRCPWNDLRNRMGKTKTGMGKASSLRKFGIVSMMPIPGSRYYPVPPYAAVFKGGWLEIKKLIQLNLKYAIKNTQTVRYHVEIHKNYWQELFKAEGVTGNLEKMQQVVKKKHEEIKEFLTNVENKGKTWISEYYIDPTGKEQRMIRINLIDKDKQGGEWTDDIAEACNMLCYADEIHPNLVGAVPGKSQTNNSGSDKRELFTMKQALMALPQKMTLKVHQTMLHYNGWWEEVGVDVPMITLTTLDTHADAQVAVNNPNI